MMIPVGYRFMPTDEELVRDYLKKKLSGELLPCHMILEREIYGEKSPWNIFGKDDPWVEMDPKESTKKTIFVFTTLKFLAKKTDNKNRIARTAGCGSWHGETGPRDIVDKKSGVVIGEREMFTFVSRDQNTKGVEGHWYMHQYALTGSSFIKNKKSPEDNNNKVVLCKITRDDGKLLKIGTRQKTKEMGSTSAGSDGRNDDSKVVDNLDGFAEELENDLMTRGEEMGITNLQSDSQYNDIKMDSLDGFGEEIENDLVIQRGENIGFKRKQLFRSLTDLEALLMSDDIDQRTTHDSYPEHPAKKMRYDVATTC